MSQIAIKVTDVSKRYRIGVQHSSGMYRYNSLRDSLSGFLTRPLQSIKQSVTREPITNANSFWALKDIEFEVMQGDVIGVIGRNGAGKSTLLKILSRITKPTTGEVQLHGRVGSLLEVGTGFHPELSGRENIFLNGAILGMTNAEVRSRFDEIVAFSEIGEFLDTPVKQYSSGMYTRLAFAVAAHMEPEILVVDEVLAVGDAAFQKKCLGKMKDVANQGRTVLFVSHNLSQIQRLCNKCLLLDRGRRLSFGDTAEQVELYSRIGAAADTAMQNRRLTPDLNLVRLIVAPTPVQSGEPCKVTLAVCSPAGTHVDDLCLLLNTITDTRIAILDLRGAGVPAGFEAGKTYQFTISVDSMPLVEGEYSWAIYARTTGGLDTAYALGTFEVLNAGLNKAFQPYPSRDRGNWELSYSCERSSLATVGASDEPLPPQ